MVVWVVAIALLGLMDENLMSVGKEGKLGEVSGVGVGRGVFDGLLRTWETALLYASHLFNEFFDRCSCHYLFFLWQQGRVL